MQHRGMHKHQHHGHGRNSLAELELGGTATIAAVNGEGALRDRLLDMGLTPGTKVMLRKVAPMGDPIELMLRGYELTLRISDAKNIEIVREGHDHRTGGEPELWKNNAVQSADGLESTCRKFSWRHRGKQGWRHPQP